MEVGGELDKQMDMFQSRWAEENCVVIPNILIGVPVCNGVGKNLVLLYGSGGCHCFLI
jgi:hypothetical protein